MPAAPGATPRKMFPPPMTTAICTPSRTTSPISATMRSMTSRLMPYASSPISASPESLSSTRRYAGSLRTLTGLGRGAMMGVLMRRERSGLCHCRHFRGKVIFFSFEPLADDEKREARDCRALRLQIFFDRLLGVAHERLAEERDFGQEFVDPAFDHLGDDFRRLAGLGSLRAENHALLFDQLLWNLVPRYAQRTHCAGRGGRGNMHCKILARWLVGTLIGNRHSDASPTMQVLGKVLRRRYPHQSADRDVFAELLNQCLTRGLDGRPAERHRRQCADISRIRLDDELRQLPRKGDEVFIAGDEIGLAVELDHGRGLAIGGDSGADDTLGRDAVRGLGRFRAALDAQQLLCLAQIAVGFRQRFFAFHHAQPGSAAQFHHHACGNVRHYWFTPRLVRSTAVTPAGKKIGARTRF